MRPAATRSIRPLLLASTILLTAPALAGGEIVTWTADAPGVWSSLFNWSGNAVPTPADAVLITSGSLITVDVNPTIEAFTLTAPATTMVCTGRTMHVLINNPLSCCSKVLAGQLDLTSSTWICPTSFQVQGLVRVSNSNFDVGEIAILPGGEMRTIGTQGIDSPFTISPGTSEGLMAVTPGTWLRFDPGAKHANGTIQHYGRLRVDHTAILYINGSHHFIGGGTTQLVGPGAIMAGWSGGELVIAETFIEGGGSLGNNSLNFELRQPFAVRANAASPLILDPAASFLNQSSLVAESASTLRLQPATYDSSALFAQIRAEDMGLVELNACLLLNGRLVTEGAGRIRVIGNTTSLQGSPNGTGLVIDGVLEVPNGINPRFVDAIHNTGVIEFLATNASTVFYVDNAGTEGVRLTGGGTLALSDSPNNIVAAWNGGEVLRNIDNLLRGAGSLGNNSVNIVNEVAGRIEADATNRLIVDPASTLTNAGAIRAVNGGTLRLQPGTFDGSAATSVIEALDGSLVELNAPSIVGGLIRSVGSGVVRVIGNTTSFIAPSAGQPLTIEGLLEVPNGVNPRFVDGIVNAGEIRLNSAGASTVFHIDNAATGGVQLSGGGTVSLGDAPSNFISAWNGGETLTNIDNLIRGAGSLGNNSINIVNEEEGRIEADATNPLLLDPAATLVNRGTIAATGGGTLRLQSGTFDQPSETGVIEARDGGVLQFNGCHMNRGLVRSVGTGVMRAIAQSSFQGDGNSLPLTLDGVLEVPNGSSIRFFDAIENRGEIRLLASNASTLVYIDNAATSGVQLTGGGTIRMEGSNSNFIAAWNGGETLTNVDNVIRGSGPLGNNSIALVNQGTILADQPAPLVVDVGPPSWTNAGDVLAAEGSLLRSQEAVLMTGGSLGGDGEVEIVANALSVGGGALRGSGRIDSNVTMTGGTIEPGPVFGDHSLGRLTVEGTMTLAPQTTLITELGGYLPGVNFDVLDVSGPITLAGTLKVAFADGFEPVVGTSFTIVAGSQISGVFASVVGPGTFSVLYRNHTVTLVVDSIAPPCTTGDLDCDGDVDAADLGTLLGAWGACGACDECVADLDGDCMVSASDLALLLGSWE